jgi:hypothetical protein
LVLRALYDDECDDYTDGDHRYEDLCSEEESDRDGDGTGQPTAGKRTGVAGDPSGQAVQAAASDR